MLSSTVRDAYRRALSSDAKVSEADERRRKSPAVERCCRFAGAISTFGGAGGGQCRKCSVSRISVCPVGEPTGGDRTGRI